MSNSVADARAQPRTKVSCRVQVQVAGQILQGRTTDISEGGLGLKLPDSIPAGQMARVQLMLPDGSGNAGTTPVVGTIRIAFNVMSQNETRLGGPWIDLPPASRSLVANYVRQQAFKMV